MPSIGGVVAALITAPAPVLLPDTCALLDILRAPRRGRAFELGAVRRVLASATTGTPPACAVIISSLLATEFAAHVADEERELSKHIDSLDSFLREFHTSCGSLGVAAAALPSLRAVPSLVGLGLLQALRTTAESMLAAATPLDPDAAAAGRAMQRVLHKRRPVKGGQGAKDANIIEEYLGLCQELRAHGFTQPIVFLSSNTSDFSADTAAKRVHPDLANEFTGVNLQYSILWNDAAQRLGV